MKGVVLAGGAGTRLRPLTFSIAKQLVPVANKPILFYGLEDLAAAGVEDVIIVISPETGEEIRARVGNGGTLGLNVEYVVQDHPRGLAHALKTALPAVGDDDVIMYLGDNLMKSGVAGVVEDFLAERPSSQILLTPVSNPSAFGVAIVDDDGGIVQLIEKPYDPPSNLALVGVYLFDRTIREAVEAIKPSSRGEYEITDAIQYLVDTGRDVRATQVTGWWKDTGKKEDLLQANALVMADLAHSVEGDVTGTTIRGDVLIDAGARVIDCVLTGPIAVAEGAEVIRSTIGPNVAIGKDASVLDAQIESSIVMDEVDVHGWRLHRSLLGRASYLRGSPPDTSVEVTLGERSGISG